MPSTRSKVGLGWQCEGCFCQNIDEILDSKKVPGYMECENLKSGVMWDPYLHCTNCTNATQLNLTYDNIQISNIEYSKFLGLMINNRLSWQSHIDLMVPKLNTATYVIRSLKQLLNLETLKKAYFSFAHSILSYGIIF